VVIDLKTDLMWEQKSDDGGVHDKDNLYGWSTGSGLPDGTAFTDFLAQLNGGATGVGNCASADAVTESGGFLGHCDWRLPSAAELQTILLAPYPCAASPCIDPVFGPTQADGYWSATTHSFPGYSIFGWIASFASGGAAYDSKTLSRSVRAVRGGL